MTCLTDLTEANGTVLVATFNNFEPTSSLGCTLRVSKDHIQVPVVATLSDARAVIEVAAASIVPGSRCLVVLS